MPEFITVTNLLGQRTLVNTDHISCVADDQNVKGMEPEFNARIDLIAGGDNCVYTRESFNEVCNLLCAGTLKRDEVIQARPAFMDTERDNPDSAAYARGWNAAVTVFLTNIGNIGKR